MSIGVQLLILVVLLVAIPCVIVFALKKRG